MSFMFARFIMKQLQTIKRITIGEVEKMWGIGTPEDLDSF